MSSVGPVPMPVVLILMCVLLAMAGKVSSDLQAIILKRPMLFSELIRQLKKAPDRAILKIVREVRDGEW